jgi:hypothetical protein
MGIDRNERLTEDTDARRIANPFERQPIRGFKTRKAPAMLVYLACTRQQPREVLAVFWSERPRSMARPAGVP